MFLRVFISCLSIVSIWALNRELYKCGDESYLPVFVVLRMMMMIIIINLSFSSCWSQASKTIFKPIRTLHKQALKVLDRKSRQYHHCDILVKYKMLSFDNSILYSDVHLVHTIIHNASTSDKPFLSFWIYVHVIL